MRHADACNSEPLSALEVAAGAHPAPFPQVRFRDGGTIPARLSAEAALAALESENLRLRDENARAQQLLQSVVDIAFITMDMDGRITGWNGGAQQILGYAPSEVLGRSGEILFTAEDRAANAFTAELCRAIEAGRAINERWHLRQDGTRFWASGLMMPLLDAAGGQHGFLNILRDRTEARMEAEQREWLMSEMNHRIKNTFAMVQSVAIQTGRHAGTPGEFQRGFSDRLAALARSHDMLVRGGWEDAPLREIIEGALFAYCGAERVSLDGIAATVPAHLVVTLTLAFHELATNAVKHGALSVPGGHVSVTWTLGPALMGTRHVDIIWRERGGPAVVQPERRGFGSHLLEIGVSAQSGGTLRLDFGPRGLECHMSLPLGTGADHG